LAVDFAAGTAPCDLKVVWVYLAHERYCSLLRLIEQTIYRLKLGPDFPSFIRVTGTNEFV
jgi:hypothetical protein